VSDDWEIGVVSKRNDLLVNHKSEDSSLGGTAVVELDGTLGHLLVLVKIVPSEVDVSVTEVTDEFVSGTWDVTHERAFQPSDEGNHLDDSGGGDGIRSGDGGDTVGERVERVTGVVNVSGKVDSSTGDDLSKEGKLTDTSVLELDVTKTVETVLVGVREHSHGVPKTERGLGTEGFLELGEDRGGLGGLLGRGESSSGGDEGGDDGGLHDVDWFKMMYKLKL
jgi:hypothetical protein